MYNPFDIREAPITLFIIILTFSVLIFEIYIGAEVLKTLVYHPDHAWYTIFLATFMHSGPTHFLSNVIFLLLFGKWSEIILKNHYYFLSYFILAPVINFVGWEMIVSPVVYLHGAAGISGMVALFLGFLLASRNKLPVKFYVFVLVFSVLLILQNIYGIINHADPTIGYGAHLCGFVIGLLLGILKDFLPICKDNKKINKVFLPHMTKGEVLSSLKDVHDSYEFAWDNIDLLEDKVTVSEYFDIIGMSNSEVINKVGQLNYHDKVSFYSGLTVSGTLGANERYYNLIKKIR